jgi:hypothetical protein
MTKILQVVLLFCCLFIAVFTQASDLTFEAIKAGSLEHKEKTLSALDMVFKHNRIDVMSRISTSRLQKSNWYKQLQRYISSSNRINLNYRSESATQEFIINDNEKQVLVVDFDLFKKTNMWYISNAYVKKWGKKRSVKGQGFSASKKTNFGKNFNSIIKKPNYYGLAPNGKLSKNFFRNKKLSLSREKNLTIKDIIIHNGTKIVDIIFLTLRYYPADYQEGDIYKSGWLIEGGGSMSSLYKNNGDNLYTKVHFKRIKLNRFNLSKKLQAESTGIFKKSRLYQRLQQYIRSNYSLKLNRNSTIARQEFTIQNQGKILVVDFSKKARKWYIADAYIKNNKEALREYGFRPLEFERNFSALVKKMKYKRIKNYYGLAPRGKLNRSFFKNKTLVAEEKPVQIKEVFIYNGNKLVDIVLLTYKYYKKYQYQGESNKKGWLLDEGFSIKASAYKRGDNLYADIIFGENLNLNVPNKGLIFYNLGELNSTPQNNYQFPY